MRGFLSLCLLAVVPLAAQQVQNIDGGPVHEAFVTSVPGVVILEAVTDKPPAKIEEKVPAKRISGAEWVPGYWAWSRERDGWVWVSGVWRRPPPGHQWIGGEWRLFDEGWTWIPGFWSGVAEDDLAFIDKRPPDPIVEEVKPPPSDDASWIPGHWSWDGKSNRYIWLGGRWDHLHPDWVFVPGHYTWRPDGYVFVPGHWDWPFEKIGQAYSNASVAPSAQVTREPNEAVSWGAIVRRLFLDYPNYLSYFHHHYYYNIGWWTGWCCAPPWWSWWEWWTLPWSDQWDLWWWWGHPDYPQPPWLTSNFTTRILPPLPKLHTMLKDKQPPPFVTPKGVVPTDQLVGKRPILPANPKKRNKLIDDAAKKLKAPAKELRPTGTEPEPGQLKRPDVLPPGERSPRGAGQVDKPLPTQIEAID